MALLLKQHDDLYLLLYALLVQTTIIHVHGVQVEGEKSLTALKEQRTVKKQLKYYPATQPPFAEANPPIDNEIINENNVELYASKPNEQLKEQQQISEKNVEKFDETKQIVSHHLKEVTMDQSEKISNSLKAGFYFFLALSSSAVIFILYKVYRLRLSRAERKYGVQGDRSNQELTPLPMADDGHSDDEDQTLFDVQRQQLRIL